jgi:hypothetical protein
MSQLQIVKPWIKRPRTLEALRTFIKWSATTGMSGLFDSRKTYSLPTSLR